MLINYSENMKQDYNELYEPAMLAWSWRQRLESQSSYLLMQRKVC